MRANFTWPDRQDPDGDTLLSGAFVRCRERLYLDIEPDRHCSGGAPLHARVELFTGSGGAEQVWPAEPLDGGGATVELTATRCTPFRVEARLIDLATGRRSVARGAMLVVPKVSRWMAVTLSLACAVLLIWALWMTNSISWESPTQRLFAGTATVIALASPIYVSTLKLTGILHNRALNDWRIPGVALILLVLGAYAMRRNVLWVANTTGRPLLLGSREVQPRANLLLWSSSSILPQGLAPTCIVAADGSNGPVVSANGPESGPSPAPACKEASSSGASPMYALAAHERVLFGCPAGSDELCCSPQRGEREVGDARARWQLRSASCEAALPRADTSEGFVGLTLHGRARSYEFELRDIDAFERYAVACQEPAGGGRCSIPIPSRGTPAMMPLKMRQAGREVGTLDCRIGEGTNIGALTSHQPGLARLVYRSPTGEVQSDWRASTPDYGDPPLFCVNEANDEQLGASAVQELRLCLTRKGVDLSRWALELDGGGLLDPRRVNFALQEDDRPLGTLTCAGGALEGGFLLTDFALPLPVEAMVSIAGADGDRTWLTTWQPALRELTLGWGCFPRGWTAGSPSVQQPKGYEIRESVDADERARNHPIATIFRPRVAASPCTRFLDGSWRSGACRNRNGSRSCITIKNWADKPDALVCDERTSWECNSPVAGDCT